MANINELLAMLTQERAPDPYGPGIGWARHPQLPGLGLPEEDMAEILASGPQDIPQAVAQGFNPLTFLASFLGGPVGAGAGIADVETNAIAQGREPEAWERGLGALGAVPLAGGALSKVPRLLGKGSKYPEALNRLAALADSVPPYTETEAYKAAGYGPLYDFVRHLVETNPLRRNYVHALEQVPETSRSSNLRLFPPTITPEILAAFKELYPEVLERGRNLQYEYAPSIAEAVKTYVSDPKIGLRKFLNAPASEAANANAITDTLLRFLGLDQIDLYRGQKIDQPLGISWTTNPSITDEFGKTRLNETFNSSDILDSFLTNRERFSTHPREQEFIRMYADTLKQLQANPGLKGPLSEFAPELQKNADVAYPLSNSIPSKSVDMTEAFTTGDDAMSPDLLKTIATNNVIDQWNFGANADVQAALTPLEALNQAPSFVKNFFDFLSVHMQEALPDILKGIASGDESGKYAAEINKLFNSGATWPEQSKLVMDFVDGLSSKFALTGGIDSLGADLGKIPSYSSLLASAMDLYKNTDKTTQSIVDQAVKALGTTLDDFLVSDTDYTPQLYTFLAKNADTISDKQADTFLTFWNTLEDMYGKAVTDLDFLA